MQERPIIFNTDMVKAIRDGRKTQTRRVITNINKYADTFNAPILAVRDIKAVRKGDWVFQSQSDLSLCVTSRCPYGQVGDRLWVRETWRTNTDELGRHKIEYRAGGEKLGIPMPIWEKYHHYLNWTPSIHMFKIVSRITLEITEVRVSRLNGMTESDAHLEGVDNLVTFMLLWDRLNKKRGYEWKSNCWVWVLTFKLCQ